jgi:hypothetical protein
VSSNTHRPASIIARNWRKSCWPSILPFVGIRLNKRNRPSKPYNFCISYIFCVIVSYLLIYLSIINPSGSSGGAVCGVQWSIN